MSEKIQKQAGLIYIKVGIKNLDEFGFSREKKINNINVFIYILVENNIKKKNIEYYLYYRNKIIFNI